MKKPIYKKWWFWLILVVLGVGALGAGGDDDDDDFTVRETVVVKDTAASSFETPDEKGQRLADEAAAEDAREQAALAEAQEIAAAQDDVPEPSAPVRRSTSVVQTEISPAPEPQPEPVADPEPEPEPVADPEPEPEPEPDSTPPPAPAKITAVVHGTDRSVSLEQGTLVWLSATGSKFHNKNNCGTMNPDKARQVTVDYATSRGFDACEKCY